MVILIVPNAIGSDQMIVVFTEQTKHALSLVPSVRSQNKWKNKMSKKPNMFSMEQFEKEMEVFRATSIWEYLRQDDLDNVFRKIRTNVWYPFVRFFKDIKYWFVYRFDPRHRYHIVKTDLRPGYYDTDHRMFSACFSLLVEFVEKECGGVHTLFYWENVKPVEEGFSQRELNSVKKKDKDIRDLYFWYTLDRPNRPEADINSLYETHRTYDKEDQEMLLSLIRIRETLWT